MNCESAFQPANVHFWCMLVLYTFEFLQAVTYTSAGRVK